MAAILLFFLLITEISISAAQQKNTTISLGSSISPNTNNSFWLSNSGQFAFGFYQQDTGFAIGIWYEKIEQKTLIWTANRNDQPLPRDVTLLLNGNGGLVLQGKEGQQISLFVSSQPAASASMLDSGNFVLYNSKSEIIWQSFKHPTDTLLPGQRLVAGQELICGVSQTNHSDGRFKLVMQTDGNLVQYLIISNPLADWFYWDTYTGKEGTQNVTLNLDPNGQLYLLNSTDSNIIKNINDPGWRYLGENVTYRLTIDVDGILRLYSHSLVQNSSWNIEWNATSNKCAPTGLCGENAYCVLIDEEPSCSCLPGFDFKDQRLKSLGCKRNSSEVDYCRIKNNDTISFVEFDGVWWENNTYSIVPSSNKNACEEECLRDCNCEIAMFKDQQCSKLMFPLRYAKADTESFATTIIKVLNGSSGTSRDTVSPIQIKKVQRMDILISGIVCIIVAFIILLLSLFLFCRSDFHSNKGVQSESNGGLLMMADEVLTLRSFTFNELEIATNGFVEQLGRGSFGTVFKGTLSLTNAQKVIAVKRLEKVAAQGEVEFLNEMRSIGRIHHKNLLRLLGYCHEGADILLVYDYMSNGSLANFLFNSEIKPSWDERVQIALDIARGILYLHEECENKIIHCDINPNNILIDENHSAKIADFGLAKLLMPDQTRTNTGIRGTRGFVAPEWHKNRPITDKADVYSFGVVLLVIICCCPSVEVNVHEKEAILVDWVYECFSSNKVRNLMQDEEADEQEFVNMVKIGLWCIQEEPTIRPAMKNVVAMFEGTVDIAVPPNLACSSASLYFLDN